MGMNGRWFFDPVPETVPWTYLAAGRQVEAIHDYELVGGNLPQRGLGGPFIRAMPEVAKP